MCVVPSLWSVAFCTRVTWVCLVCLMLCKEEDYSLVSLQLLRGGMWACMRCPCLCLCWVWDGDYVSQLPYVWYYVVVKSSFYMLVRNANRRGPMCFRCLMFSLSGHCELLFFALDLNCGECDVISLYFMCCSVNGSVCLVCCVFDSVCELVGEPIRNMFECGCYFVVQCYGSV